MLSLLISPGYSTFIGPGSLVLGGPSVISAITCPRTYRLTLTEDATLEISASGCGIDAMYDNMMDPDPRFPDLVVDNSSLIITAPTCLRMMKALWLSECHVVAPSDFQYQLNTWIPLTTWIQNYLEIRAGMVGLPVYESCDWRAWGVDGGIRIEGLSENQTVDVQNILGQTVHKAASSGTCAFIPLKTGLYLVRVNNHAVKTIVN